MVLVGPGRNLEILVPDTRLVPGWHSSTSQAAFVLSAALGYHAPPFAVRTNSAALAVLPRLDGSCGTAAAVDGGFAAAATFVGCDRAANNYRLAHQQGDTLQSAAVRRSCRRAQRDHNLQADPASGRPEGLPALAKMARQFLGRPASSAGVERMFSKAGKLYDDAKKQENHESLENALFAAANTE